MVVVVAVVVVVVVVVVIAAAAAAEQTTTQAVWGAVECGIRISECNPHRKNNVLRGSTTCLCIYSS